MKKKSLFEKSIFEECIKRLDSIEQDAMPLWGQMSPAQMFAHCNEVQIVANGEKDFKTNFFFKMLRPLIARGVFGDKPYDQSTRTAPQYVITDSRDFDVEKSTLIAALQRFQQKTDKEINALRHPFFGHVPKDKLGWGMYKHLDHHLRQFGA
ncbi:MAG: DUF1569 domain-containing protein [Saprospiraceae bacterium]|nr:DUF1569 domain-containing protein [Saprospiraceae bacterium]